MAAPKSALGKALTYLKDGRLELSNNRAERRIKPLVIDRRSFLFANTPRAPAAAPSCSARSKRRLKMGWIRTGT